MKETSLPILSVSFPPSLCISDNSLITLQEMISSNKISENTLHNKYFFSSKMLVVVMCVCCHVICTSSALYENDGIC